MISSGFEQSDWSVRTARRLSEQLSQTGVLGTRLAYLLTRSGPDTSSGPTPSAYGPRISRHERLVLKERPHRTHCGRPRTQRLHSTMVPELVRRFVVPTAYAQTVG